MQNLDHQINSQQNKNSRIYTKRHHEIIDALERLLEQGVPELTMSEIAKKLKILGVLDQFPKFQNLTQTVIW